MRSKIKKAYKLVGLLGPVTHKQMKNYLQVDWNIQLMSAYVNFHGLTFDKEIKKWRQSKTHIRILKKKKETWEKKKSEPFAGTLYDYINTH